MNYTDQFLGTKKMAINYWERQKKVSGRKKVSDGLKSKQWAKSRFNFKKRQEKYLSLRKRREEIDVPLKAP